jgi:hypothetical protein
VLCVVNFTHEIQTYLYSALAIETPYPRMAVVLTIRTSHGFFFFVDSHKTLHSLLAVFSYFRWYLLQSKLYRFETPKPHSLNGKPPIEVLVPDTSRGGRAGRKFGLSTAGTWSAKMRKTALQ